MKNPQERGLSIITGGYGSGKSKAAQVIVTTLKKETVIIFDPKDEYSHCDLDDKAEHKHLQRQFKEITKVMSEKPKQKRVFRIINKELALLLMGYGFKNCSVVVELDSMLAFIGALDWNIDRWNIPQNHVTNFIGKLCVESRQNNTDVLFIATRPTKVILRFVEQALVLRGAKLDYPNTIISKQDYQVLINLPTYSWYGIENLAEPEKDQNKMFYIAPLNQLYSITPYEERKNK